MKCPRCPTHDLVEITMKLGSDPVVLRSCSSCDLRSWEGLDGSIPLGAVLDLVAGR
jgi:transcription elongation factor Elf1